MTRVPLTNDDRAVSIAVTHVLTIGITTVLIAGLLVGAGTMLDSERDRSTEDALVTIGERLANEISAVDRAAEDADEVVVRTSHQQEVTNTMYTVDLDDDCDDPLLPDEPCLVLTAHGEDVEVFVPVRTNTPIDPDSSAIGGSITIHYDGTSINLVDGDP